LMDVLAKRPDGFTDADMDDLLYKSFTSPTWEPSSYVLSDLKNSGRLSDLNDDNLKSRLFAWERLFDETTAVTNSYRLYAQEYYKYITAHGSTRNVDALFEGRYFGKSTLDVSNIVMLDEPAFENSVSNFLALAMSLQLRYQLANVQLTEIIESIQPSQ